MSGRAILAFIALFLAGVATLGRVDATADAFASFLPLAIVFAFLALVPLRGRPQKWTALAALTALAGASLAILPELAARRRDPPPSGSPQLILVTHNVGVANVDPEGTVRQLGASDADILLLQETDGKVASYLDILAARFPYRNRCLRRCSMAIFSRWPIEQVRYRMRNKAGVQIGPPLLRTQIQLRDGTKIPVITLHLPWPIPPEPHARMRDDLIQALAEADKDRLILAGDFNLTPWAEAMRQLDAGLAPLRRPTRALASFPARVWGHATLFPILPIDQVFVGPFWSVRSAARLPRTGSDHYPLRVVLIGKGRG